MRQSKLVLVTGATGQQGGSVVTALLARGHRVRALTRNIESPAAKDLRNRGVGVARGDFTDPTSLQTAAQGVDAVFAMSTPIEAGIESETAQGIAMVDAMKAAGVRHMIFSSVASADRATGIPHFESKYKVEKHLMSSGVSYSIVAPVFFMENVLQSWVSGDWADGKIAMAMPGDRSLQHVAVANIGEFVAVLIERGESVFGKRFDIAGFEGSGDEIARILSRASECEIRYEGFPPDGLRPQFEDMALMFEWFDKTGYSVDLEGLRRDFSEINWLSFEAWAKKQELRLPLTVP